MELEKTNRNNTIDIIKAIGIILMVLVHAGCPIEDFVSIFNMPIFFIASGYTYNDKYHANIESFIKFFIKKIKYLYLPFVFWNSLFTVLNNILIKMNIYTDNIHITEYITGEYISTKPYLSIKEIINNVLLSTIFGGGTQLTGGFWFLRVLFFTSLLYCFFNMIIKNIFKNSDLANYALSILFLVFGFICYKNNIDFDGLATCFSCYPLIFIGNLLRKKYKKQQNNIIGILGNAVLLFIILLLLSKFGFVAIGINSYSDPIFLILTSTIGWFFIYDLAKIISLLSISKCFSIIGQNTLCILTLHFLSFKIITYIKIIILDLPLFCLAAFPTFNGYEDGWWILYTLFGIFVPILFKLSFIRVKYRLLNYISN